MVAAEVVALGGHAGGAVVEVTDAQVLAAERHHRGSAEAETLGPEHGRLDHVQAGLEAAVGLQADRSSSASGGSPPAPRRFLPGGFVRRGSSSCRRPWRLGPPREL